MFDKLSSNMTNVAGKDSKIIASLQSQWYIQVFTRGLKAALVNCIRDSFIRQVLSKRKPVGALCG